jgi:hypothetical protein
MVKKPKIRHGDIQLAIISIILVGIMFTFLPIWMAWVSTVVIVLAFLSTIYEIFGPTGPK